MSLTRAGGLASTYKVTLCPAYEEGGEKACPDGPFCRLAHGESDRRTRAQNEADGIVGELGLFTYWKRLDEEKTVAHDVAAKAEVKAPAISADPTTPIVTGAAEPTTEGDGAIRDGIDSNGRGAPSMGYCFSGAHDDEEAYAISELLSALEVIDGEDTPEMMEEEKRIVEDAREALRKELALQMSACGIPLPAFLASAVSPHYDKTE